VSKEEEIVEEVDEKLLHLFLDEAHDISSDKDKMLI
jgi:hypothetical protein